VVWVAEVDGQLVTYDNRRLGAARELEMEREEYKVSIIRVDPDAPHPDGSKKNWWRKFQDRFRDIINIEDGGVVPDKG